MPLPDHVLLNSKGLPALVPVELDDEYIFSDHTFPQPPDHISLGTGFKCMGKILLCFVDLPVRKYRFQQSETSGQSKSVIHTLRGMYDRAVHVLDDVPPQLSDWHPGYGNVGKFQGDPRLAQ